MLLFTENWKQHDDDDEDNDGSVTGMKFRLLLSILNLDSFSHGILPKSSLCFKVMLVCLLDSYAKRWKTFQSFLLSFQLHHILRKNKYEKMSEQSHLLLLSSLLRLSPHIACILMNQLTHEILLYLLWAPTIARVYMRHKTRVDVSRRLCERACPKARRVVVSVA